MAEDFSELQFGLLKPDRSHLPLSLSFIPTSRIPDRKILNFRAAKSEDREFYAIQKRRFLGFFGSSIKRMPGQYFGVFFLQNSIQYPTEYFTIQGPQNPSINDAELNTKFDEISNIVECSVRYESSTVTVSGWYAELLMG